MRRSLLSVFFLIAFTVVTFATNVVNISKVKTLGSVPSERESCACAFAGKNFYVYGGRSGVNTWNGDLSVLDSDTNTWSQVPTPKNGPSPRGGHSMTKIGDKLYVFGGRVSLFSHSNELFAFDTIRKEWSKLTSQSAPSGRQGHASATIGHKLYIHGGFDNVKRLNDFYSFDTETGKWSQIEASGSVPCPREGHKAVVVQGRLYLFGGSDGTYSLSDIHVFDPATSAWELIPASGAHPRAFHSADAFGTLVHVVAGLEGSTRLSDVQVFDTVTRTWLVDSVSRSLELTPRQGHCSATAPSGTRALLFGGSMSWTRTFNDVFVMSSAYEQVVPTKPDFVGDVDSTLIEARRYLAEVSDETSAIEIEVAQLRESDAKAINTVDSDALRARADAWKSAERLVGRVDAAAAAYKGLSEDLGARLGAIARTKEARKNAITKLQVTHDELSHQSESLKIAEDILSASTRLRESAQQTRDEQRKKLEDTERDLSSAALDKVSADEKIKNLNKRMEDLEKKRANAVNMLKNAQAWLDSQKVFTNKLESDIQKNKDDIETKKQEMEDAEKQLTDARVNHSELEKTYQGLEKLAKEGLDAKKKAEKIAAELKAIGQAAENFNKNVKDLLAKVGDDSFISDLVVQRQVATLDIDEGKLKVALDKVRAQVVEKSVLVKNREQILKDRTSAFISAQNEGARLQAEFSNQQKLTEMKKGDVADAERQLAVTDPEFKLLSQEKLETETKIQACEQRLTKLREEVEQLTKGVADASTYLGDRASEEGRASVEVSKQKDAISETLRAHAKAFDQARLHSEHLDKLRAELKAWKGEHNVKRVNLLEAVKTVKEAQEKADAVLIARIRELEAQNAKLQIEIASLKDRLSGNTSTSGVAVNADGTMAPVDIIEERLAQEVSDVQVADDSI